MFRPCKYTTWYNSIISKAKTERKLDYSENHHIVPKSLGGSKKKDNMVRLTAKEHYICHLLLMKMVTTIRDKHKMAAAFRYMQSTKNKYHQRYTSKLYEQHTKISKKIHKERMTGRNNPMFGKQRTEKWKQQYSEMRRGWSTNTKESNERKRQKWLTNNPNNDPVSVQKHVKKKSKRWLLIMPDEAEICVENLSKFSRENGLLSSEMVTIADTNRTHKGWKCQRTTA